MILNDFRFGFGIFTTHLPYICLKCLFPHGSIYVCQMCGKYAKTKFEIMKHLKKEHILFVHSKPLLEKANATLILRLLDNPNPLIRNVSAQPLSRNREKRVSYYFATYIHSLRHLHTFC